VTLALVAIALAAGRAAVPGHAGAVAVHGIVASALARSAAAATCSRKSWKIRSASNGNDGALAFSLIKHSSLLMLGLSIYALQAGEPRQVWQNLLESALISSRNISKR
jgi:hypothetical protein